MKIKRDRQKHLKVAIKKGTNDKLRYLTNKPYARACDAKGRRPGWADDEKSANAVQPKGSLAPEEIEQDHGDITGNSN